MNSGAFLVHRRGCLFTPSGLAKGCAILLLELFAASSCHAQGRVECSAVKSSILSRAVRYCALLPPTYDAGKSRRLPVLYYLHGLGENEQALLTSGGWNLVEDLRAAGRIGDFLIVTPDGGRSFYINSRDARTRWEDFFLREFLPAIERKYRVRSGEAARGIAGTSMGGYGALHLAFRHPDLFVSVSAHSAVLYAKPPVSGSADPRLAWAQQALLGPPFGIPLDRAWWEQNNPLTLAKSAAGLSALRIYFDCGSEDDYGFDAGARALHAILKSRGLRHQTHIYPGRHSWEFVAAHFGESLAFHSRAFGLPPNRP